MIIVPLSVILWLFLGMTVIGLIGGGIQKKKEYKQKERFVVKKYGLKKMTKVSKVLLIMMIPMLFFFSIVGGVIMVAVPALTSVVSAVIVLTLNGMVFYMVFSYVRFKRAVKRFIKIEFGDSRVS